MSVYIHCFIESGRGFGAPDIVHQYAYKWVLGRRKLAHGSEETTERIYGVFPMQHWQSIHLLETELAEAIFSANRLPRGHLLIRR